MEMIRTTPDSRTDARKEFEAHVEAAIELALELERNLIQWGKAMEAKRLPLAA